LSHFAPTRASRAFAGSAPSPHLIWQYPTGGYLADVGPKLQAFFRGRNLLLRPLGNTIYVMPPYCVTAADLDEIYVGISDAADELV